MIFSVRSGRPRRAGAGARPLPVPGLAALAVAALALTGCTSSFLGTAGPVAAPDSTAPASENPEPGASTTPEPDYDCDDLVLNRPGNYVLGECGTVTLAGTGIDLTFTSIATLVVRANRVNLVGAELGSLLIEGKNNDVEIEALESLRIRGEGNTVVADGNIGSVVVDGNENVVSAGEGIASVIDNGLLNEID